MEHNWDLMIAYPKKIKLRFGDKHFDPGLPHGIIQIHGVGCWTDYRINWLHLLLWDLDDPPQLLGLHSCTWESLSSILAFIDRMNNFTFQIQWDLVSTFYKSECEMRAVCLKE